MFFEYNCIEQQTTVPYAQETNGTVEIAIRTNVTIGRSMPQHAKLKKCFWGEAAMTDRVQFEAKSEAHARV